MKNVYPKKRSTKIHIRKATNYIQGVVSTRLKEFSEQNDFLHRELLKAMPMLNNLPAAVDLKNDLSVAWYDKL
ncbi:MAG: hypothetical protein AB7F64_07850 [Gammaproteobacteria bacterium]